MNVFAIARNINSCVQTSALSENHDRIHTQVKKVELNY